MFIILLSKSHIQRLLREVQWSPVTVHISQKVGGGRKKSSTRGFIREVECKKNGHFRGLKLALTATSGLGFENIKVNAEIYFTLFLFHKYIVQLLQQCHNSKCVIFQERLLKILKCYNFLWVQRRHNCSPAASFANCVMTLYLLKVHLQTFLSIPVTKKCQILSCDTLCRKWAMCSLVILYYIWLTYIYLYHTTLAKPQRNTNTHRTKAIQPMK